MLCFLFFFFSSRRRHTRCSRDWSSDVCSSDLPWFEEYMTDDAEVILVGMGTISLPIKVAIREMRAKGKKVGLVRLRWFRPFPTDRLVAALSRAQALGVIDRDYSFGSPFGSGLVANEIRAALYNAARRPPLLSFICGLGGREVTLEDG